MDWLGNMRAAIGYIEDNLAGEIDFEIAARHARCSSYHFQKMFSCLTNVPPGEYIRRRRLTLAAFELQQTDAKVVDVALKYGWDSPTSFTRAFRSVHGVTPKEAKRAGTRLKSWPRIAFQISIKGDTEMNYRIERKKSFRVVGCSKAIPTGEGINFELVPNFWEESCANGSYERLCVMAKESRADCVYPGAAILGICANFRKDEFDYLIAVPSSRAVPEGMTALEIPEANWAVFECTGPLPGAIQDVTKRIYSEWFPSSGYENAMLPEIEWYSEGDTSAADYRSEVWIPVKAKN
jgi:Uncharacterized protein conserved in bacteria